MSCRTSILALLCKILVPATAFRGSIVIEVLRRLRRVFRSTMAEPGNKGFVEGLFARHQATLQTFFRRRIKTGSDAPDLVQEVYLRMLRVSDAEAIRNPEVYLFTVASNLAKEHSVLDRRQANQVDIDEWSVQESLGE